MLSHIPIGLVPAHFRPKRRAREASPPVAERQPTEPPAAGAPPPQAARTEPEPVAEAPEPAPPEPVICAPTPAPPPSYNLPHPRKRWRKDDVPALQRCSEALGYVAKCDSACCVRAKRCLWARGGRCMREEVLPPAQLMWT